MKVNELKEILEKTNPEHEVHFIQMQENFWGEMVEVQVNVEEISKNNEKLEILLSN